MEGKVNTSAIPTHGEDTNTSGTHQKPATQTPAENVSNRQDEVEHPEETVADVPPLEAATEDEANLDKVSTEENRGSDDEAPDVLAENPEADEAAVHFSLVECVCIEYEESIEEKEEEVKGFYYKMDHPKRGVAVIFNNGTFSSAVDLPDRPGYQEEGAVLKEAFSHLGFDVRYYQDLTVQNIITVIELLRREGHKDADCLCVTFMTHGMRQEGTTNDVIFGKDGPLWVENIISKFNGEGCRSLAGKPKLFFVQASRGTQEDRGVRVKVHDTESDYGWKRTTFPLEADIVLAQSTGGGYTSIPNEPSGSIYVHSLARTLVDYGRTKDIHWLLTRVNGLVAAGFGSDGNKQMPVYRSTLTKVLTFPEHTAPKPAFVL